MKRTISILISLAALVIIPACQKVVPVQDDPAAKKQVTVTASIPADGITTRVALTQDETNKKTIKLSWEIDDVITINGETFTIDPATISSNGKTAQFTGNDPGSGPYTIAYSALPGGFAEQTQSADGNTDHLGYGASLAGVTDYEVFSFDSEWAAANGATLEQSSVLRLRALLPADVASSVQKVIFKASDDVLAGGNTLTVTLTAPGTKGTDNELDVYATLPAGDVTLSEDMDLLIQFQVSDAAYDKFTAYRKVASGTHFVVSGQSQYLGIKCTNIEQYAGTNDAGTEDNPYLIGDRHQLAAVHDLASTTSKTYFKMIDDVDMTDMTSYVPINESIADFAQVVDFDGNQKAVSHLGKHLFYVLKGSVYDLTLDYSDISTRGILAEYIQGSDNVVTNVTVSHGAVNYSGSNVGGLIGYINKGSNTAATITGCTVISTTVEGAGVVGGVIGFADAKVSVSDCKFAGSNVTSNGRYVGGFVGSTGNYGSSFVNCQVENATIQSTVSNNDFRAGGFVGQLQTNVQIKGCTVGTSDNKITLSLSEPTSGKVYNAGGFVGVCYGTVTKKDDIRNKTFVKIIANNTTTTANVNIGGFAGYVDGGRIEYSDAEVDMSGLKGQRIGGFAGYITNKASTIDQCTVDGTVAGNHYTGGFVGYIDNKTPVITNNTVKGTVSGNSTVGGLVGVYGKTKDNAVVAPDESEGYQGTFTGNTSSATVSGASNVGGLMGYCWAPATIIKNVVSANITSSGGSIGGLIGSIETSITVTGSSYDGTISAGGDRVGGIIGNVNQATSSLNVNNCWSGGTISVSRTKQRIGGIVGNMNVGGSITNCYSTAILGVGRVLGGIVGYACAGSGGNWNTSNASGINVSECIAWNPSVAWDPGTETNTNYGSSGAIVGFTSVKNVLSNCYRRSDMTYQNSNQQGTCQTTMVDQPNCDGTNWTKGTTIGTDGANNCPYYGVAAASSATVSSIAQTLGWSGDVWDFTGDQPVLK